MNYDITNSKFIENFKQDAIASFKIAHPEWDEKKMDKVISKMITSKISIPQCEIDNNFTKERRDTNLLTILDWTYKRKPLIAGNGTFYKNQYEAINPIASMLNGFLTKRKSLKKEMFAIQDKTSRRYADLDLQQAIQKVNANSYYGASGMPSSAFYSLYSGPATTASAQSVISTANATFEGFIMDNFYFYDINECFNWLLSVNRKIDEDASIDKWVMRHDADEVFEKLKRMFLEWHDRYEPLLRDYLSNLSVTRLTRIYYANQLMEFTKDHSYVMELNKKILDDTIVYPVVNKKDPDWESKIPKKFKGEYKTAEDYNDMACQVAFMDPNKPPKEIKDTLEKLSEIYLKYVYHRYSAFDRIYRLKNFGRKCVVVIDTDSNIIALDTWIQFMNDMIAKNTDKPKENVEFILVNSITYTLSAVITDTLLNYGADSNVPEEFRPIYNMKNEFFMRRLAIGNVKKRYLSLFKLREGNLLNPPKTDIKGFDFKKSVTSDKCEEIFTKLAEDYVLKSDTIDVPALMKELRQMEKDIKESILNNEIDYLPIGNVKEDAAYADPGSEQSVRGAITWNLLYPDKMIERPSKVKLIKLNIFCEEDIKELQYVDKRAYDIIIDKIFHDTTGIFVVHGVDNKTGKAKVKIRGMQCIAIPTTQTIPEWIKPYIDYNTMINTIMGPFKSVMELLKMPYISEGKTKNGVSRKTNKLSNIIIF